MYWIPRSILSDRHFRTLEEYVNLNKLRPFYNLASDAVHAGSKGFYRLGLRSDEQDKIFLVGASNYGLADPLQNTAISLSHVSGCLLLLNPDFENLIQSQVILNYVKEIGISAVDVHKSFENEERAK